MACDRDSIYVDEAVQDPRRVALVGSGADKLVYKNMWTLIFDALQQIVAGRVSNLIVDQN